MKIIKLIAVSAAALASTVSVAAAFFFASFRASSIRRFIYYNKIKIKTELYKNK